MTVKVSTRGDYACRALLSLSLHQDGTAPTSVREIAARTGLPEPYLEQILLALKGAGLVKSKRGAGGGYLLARPPDQILLNEIISAVDGPIVAGNFGDPHTDGACDHEGQCVLLSIWGFVGDRMRELLASFTLADIAGMARGERAWPEDTATAKSPGPEDTATAKSPGPDDSIIDSADEDRVVATIRDEIVATTVIDLESTS